jgi:hypothetical protein
LRITAISGMPVLHSLNIVSFFLLMNFSCVRHEISPRKCGILHFTSVGFPIR